MADEPDPEEIDLTEYTVEEHGFEVVPVSK